MGRLGWHGGWRSGIAGPRKPAGPSAYGLIFHNISYANDGLKSQHLRQAHKLADEHEDVATASLLENFIDEAEKRCWFLFEASRAGERSGH
jgi:hypothetical protein